MKGGSPHTTVDYITLSTPTSLLSSRSTPNLSNPNSFLTEQCLNSIMAIIKKPISRDIKATMITDNLHAFFQEIGISDADEKDKHVVNFLTKIGPSLDIKLEKSYPLSRIETLSKFKKTDPNLITFLGVIILMIIGNYTLIK